VVWSFVYLALCRLVQLVVLLCKSERSKNSRSSCSDMSWRSCVGSRGERRFDPWIGQSGGARAGATAECLGKPVGESGDAAALAPPAG
jgi:hypothetical protein